MRASQSLPCQLEEIFPLTPVQNFILDISRMTPSGLAFQQQYTYYLTGEVDPQLVQESWEVIVARHPSLRTSFHCEGTSQSFQVVHRKAPLPFLFRDLRGLGEDERTAAVLAWLMEDAKKPFDLLVPPLMRLALTQLEDRLFVLTLTMSHLIFDGWSLGASFNLFAQTYARLIMGEEPDRTPFPSMHSYVTWYRKRDTAADTAWWQERLKDAVLPRLPFMRVHEHTGPVEADQIHHMVLDQEETAVLEQGAKSMGITLNVLYQAAWALILSRLSPERRALMLTVAASRPMELEHIDQVFGVLIDGVPYHLHCPGDLQVEAWLGELRSLQLESLEHQYTPIQAWIQMGREPGVIPFNSYLIFENHATGEGEKEDAAFSLNAAYMNSNLSFPLSMMVFPGPALRVAIIYSSDFFGEEGILAFTERLRATLKALAANPGRTLDEISALALLDEEHLTQGSIVP